MALVTRPTCKSLRTDQSPNWLIKPRLLGRYGMVLEDKEMTAVLFRHCVTLCDEAKTLQQIRGDYGKKYQRNLDHILSQPLDEKDEKESRFIWLSDETSGTGFDWSEIGFPQRSFHVMNMMSKENSFVALLIRLQLLGRCRRIDLHEMVLVLCFWLYKGKL